MRRYIFLFFLIVSGPLSRAQFGNEWINPGQPYLKISTAEEGVYRLWRSDLEQAGFPAASMDPRHLRLFHHGRQCAIHVSGANDGIFDAGDYILFYGFRNDGTSDSPLYPDPDDQPHLHYNLFSDTTAFFLTYDPAFQGIRMDSLDLPNTAALAPEPYHIAETLLIVKENYSAGEAEVSGLISSTAFGKNEGWGSHPINNGQFREYTLAIADTEPGGELPHIELLVFGRGPQPSTVDIQVGSPGGAMRPIASNSFAGFERITISEPLQWSDFSASGTITVRIQCNGAASEFDAVSVGYIRIRYPQLLTMGTRQHRTFRLKESGTNEAYVEIAGAASYASALDVTDPYRARWIKSAASAVIESTSTSRTIVVSQIPHIPRVQSVTFQQIDPEAYDFVVISHRLLMKPAGGFGNIVQAYADYRASEAGGSFRPLVVEVGQLYDQFNYGEISPVAIRRFMAFLISRSKPKYLFIIGNGLDFLYNYYRSPQTFAAQRCLVPPAGYPASDAFYTFDLGGVNNAPAVPTGRITALHPNDIAAYLEKVKQTESLSYDNLWRKNILHLSGGIRPGEPERFANYEKDFQKTAEDIHLGGRVTAIAKQSTKPVEFINIKDQVNRGLNLVTFFGHSATTVIDFDIGFVSNPQLEYDNGGKYPMFLINGCNAGSFFVNGTLFGEDWINTPGKGAIGFIAHTSVALENTLKRYSDIFYEVAYGDSTFIKKGIGDIQKEVAIRYMSQASPLLSHLSQVQQMFLLGDPAVKLFGATKPDYALDPDQVFLEAFDGQPLTALSDSFAVRMIVPNFGLALKDTLRVQVKRTFADQGIAIYDTLFSTVLYQDTLTVTIRKGTQYGGGDNSFEITLDPDNDIAELNENNNTVVFTYMVPLNRTKNLFPTDFAIVADRNVKVWIQSTDLLSSQREYDLEIDTVYTFNSPFKLETTVSGETLASYSFQLADRDSTVYYWRTRFTDPQPGESADWEQSSFSFIEGGPEGWAQIEFPQYLKNSLEGLVQDEAVELTRFEETTTLVDLIVHGSAVPGVNQYDVSVRLNSSEYQINTQSKACRLNTINLIAFEKVSTTPYAPVPIKFQDFRTCGRQPQVINSFRVNEFFGVDPDTGEPAGVIEAIDNVQPGDSVVFFSIGNAEFSTWPASVKAKMGEVGVSVAQLESLIDGEPVVIFGKKGIAPGAAVIHRSSLSPANSQSLVVNGSVTGRYTNGWMNSRLIGPALHWDELIMATEEPEPQDVAGVDIIGVALDGTETKLMEQVTASTDLSAINAEEYPYLKLYYRTEDNLNLTATQLEKWMVLFTTVPEGILWFDGSKDEVTLSEGQTWNGHYGFINISDKEFTDSLTVELSSFNERNRNWERKEIRISPPAPNDTTHFSYVLNTRGRAGANTVNTFVNPRILREQYYDNNVIELRKKVWVEADMFAPVMEVTVDGRVLRNGDFVAQNPEIRIRMWDENVYMLKSDTLGIKILLHRPCGQPPCANPAIYFSRGDVSWTAATDSTDFIVRFLPENLENGIYTLSVEVSDENGNAAGDHPYEVSFEVRDEARQVMLAPYPNPGSSFVFTLVLSGDVPPDAFSIQIYSVDGKLVRQISLPHGLGIGTNEIPWDGTNDQGYALPQGIYLYRLSLSKNGTQLPIQVPAQTTLGGGFGKLAIIR